MLEDSLQPDRALRLVVVDKATAADFIRRHHSQLPDPNLRGILYAIGARAGQRLVAVATAGTPTGRWKRRIDPRRILELTRVASDGTPYKALREKGLRPVAYLKGKAPGGARSGGSLAQVDKISWEAGAGALAEIRLG